MSLEKNNPIDAALQALALENTSEVRFDKEQICQIHNQMIELYGGQLGIRDNNLLESVVSAPYQEYFGEVLYPSIFDKAAKYLFDFANYQIFLDGNKRTGLGVCQAYLHEHGFDFKDDFGTKAYILVLDIANHKYSEPQEIVDYIKDNVVIIPEKLQEVSKSKDDIKLNGGQGSKDYLNLVKNADGRADFLEMNFNLDKAVKNPYANEQTDSIESGPDL